MGVRLFDRFMTRCTRKVLTRVADGEGGWVDTWADGSKFDAAIVLDTSATARIAEAQGFTASCTVTVPMGTGLAFHEAFVRDKDGAGFRIVKRNDDTPEAATFAFEQYQAERWGVPE